MIPIKIADYIIKFLFVIALLLIATKATSCEVFNYDTSKCELMNEQNLSINSAWIEFY